MELMRKRVYDMAGILGKTVKVRAGRAHVLLWLVMHTAGCPLCHLQGPASHTPARSTPALPPPHPTTANPTPPARSPTHPQVYYNGTRLKCKTFQEYVELYLGPKDGGVPRVYERFSDRWEVCIATTEGQFNQVWGRGQNRAGCGAKHREEDRFQASNQWCRKKAAAGAK